MNARASRLVAIALSAALVLAGCGDDDDTSSSSTTADTGVDDTTTTTDGGDDTTTTTTSAPEESGTVIEISVAGGEVTNGGRHEIPLGEEVVLRVTSDEADEVHVHGYDLTVDLAPGQPGEIAFTADIPGVFEAELHDSGIVLAELQIQ